MIVYADLAALLNFAVDFLLILAANRLSGYGLGWKRAIPAAVVGGIYAAICLAPQLRFLGNTLWRLVSLTAMSVIAFGWNPSALRRGVLFSLLSMALGGLAMGFTNGGFVGLLASMLVVGLMSFFGLQGRAGHSKYLPVQLKYGRKTYDLTALYDTGNLLRDPITGKNVLLVGSDVAWDVLGLQALELTDPVECVSKGRIPGARLISYHAVGQPGGMLLAVKMDEVIINGQPSGRLVAFAPNILSREKSYQALTGGVL